MKSITEMTEQELDETIQSIMTPGDGTMQEGDEITHAGKDKIKTFIKGTINKMLYRHENPPGFANSYITQNTVNNILQQELKRNETTNPERVKLLDALKRIIQKNINPTALEDLEEALDELSKIQTELSRKVEELRDGDLGLPQKTEAISTFSPHQELLKIKNNSNPPITANKELIENALEYINQINQINEIKQIMQINQINDVKFKKNQPTRINDLKQRLIQQKIALEKALNDYLIPEAGGGARSGPGPQDPLYLSAAQQEIKKGVENIRHEHEQGGDSQSESSNDGTRP